MLSTQATRRTAIYDGRWRSRTKKVGGVVSSIAHPLLLPHTSRASAPSFRVLGPLEVRLDGQIAVLHRERQRILLALLLVQPGRRVSTGQLIDELWVGDPPQAARASLQNSVCQLRKALGPDLLLTGVDGYWLDINAEQVDVGRFRRIVADARAAASIRCRARKLRDALALWRGPAYADIRQTRSLEFEASLLTELRTSALEDAIDAELELGCAAALVPELERLIDAEPYRERPRAQLMLALYRSGRQLGALEAFKEARQTLVSSVGLEPSPPLRALERAILNHDPRLRLAPSSRRGTRTPLQIA